MNPETLGILAIAVMVFLFLIGFPVAFSMAIVGLAGFGLLVGWEQSFTLLAQDFFETFSAYSLSVIPMFILMGSFAFVTGISRRLYTASYKWVGHYHGGLTIATVIACSGFAAICGSTTATAATMGKIALPEMKKYGYKDILATGAVAAAGTLGVMIPPSTIFIIYGLMTEQSIGKLFIAGVAPGILLALAFVVTVIVLCKRDPKLGPPGPRVSFGDKLRSLGGLTETIILFVLAIGGLFAGWFSPTQAGAIGAGGTILIGLARRTMTWKSFFDASVDGLRSGCMILFIVTGATLFGHFMAITNIPTGLADWIGALQMPVWVVMLLIVCIYFVGGFFMDSLPLVVVTLPIFYPLVMKLGFDPIWFGVIIVLICEMGVLTPPVGVNVFVIKGISPDVPLGIIFRGIFPFLGAMIIVTIIIGIFPQIATFLPKFITY